MNPTKKSSTTSLLITLFLMGCASKPTSWQVGKAIVPLEKLQWLVGNWNCVRHQVGIKPKVYDWVGKNESVHIYWDIKGFKLVSDYTGFYEGNALLTRCYYGWLAASSRAQLVCVGNSNMPAVVEEGPITEQGEPRFSGTLEMDKKMYTTTKNFTRISDNKYQAQYFFRPVKDGDGMSFDQTISCERRK
jgi:hypothetical protein